MIKKTKKSTKKVVKKAVVKTPKKAGEKVAKKNAKKVVKKAAKKAVKKTVQKTVKKVAHSAPNASSKISLLIPEIKPGVLTRKTVGDDVLVLDTDNNKLFEISGLAAQMWVMLEEGWDEKKIASALFKGRTDKEWDELVNHANAFAKHIIKLGLTIK